MGLCTSKQIVEHYEELCKDMDWNSNYLLHMKMDGPNVNLGFKENLSSELNGNTADLSFTLELVFCTQAIRNSDMVSKN